MSKFDVTTFSPEDVTLTFGGYLLTGWNTITISRSTPPYTMVRGIRGKNTRVRNVDTSATISFSCLQSSDSNDILSDVLAKDIVYGTGRVVITLKDNSGSSVFSSDEAFLTGYPEATFSGSLEYRVWSIACLTTESSYNVGGNADSTSILDKAKGLLGSASSALSGAADSIKSVF